VTIQTKVLKVSPLGFKSARTDDASFSNVRTLADASSCKAEKQVNNIARNYSPEVETEKPFTRKRKENDLDGKVLCVF